MVVGTRVKNESSRKKRWQKEQIKRYRKCLKVRENKTKVSERKEKETSEEWSKRRGYGGGVLVKTQSDGRTGKRTSMQRSPLR